MEMLANARRLEMAVQVNTTITRRNYQQDRRVGRAAGRQGHCHVGGVLPDPRGARRGGTTTDGRRKRGGVRQALAPRPMQPYSVKTTEAPHYRRFVLQQGGDPLAGPTASPTTGDIRGHRAPLGVGDGKGVMFVSHRGEIYPSGFPAAAVRSFPREIGGRHLSESLRRFEPSRSRRSSTASVGSASTASLRRKPRASLRRLRRSARVRTRLRLRTVSNTVATSLEVLHISFVARCPPSGLSRRRRRTGYLASPNPIAHGPGGGKAVRHERIIVRPDR